MYVDVGEEMLGFQMQYLYYDSVCVCVYTGVHHLSGLLLKSLLITGS